jgi:hypothetical protein
MAVISDSIYRSLAVIFLMGIICRPTMELYWSADEMLAIPFFGKCVPQNHFSSIHKFLHFPVNETDHRINKIHSVYDHFDYKILGNVLSWHCSDCG